MDRELRGGELMKQNAAHPAIGVALDLGGASRHPTAADAERDVLPREGAHHSSTPVVVWALTTREPTPVSASQNVDRRSGEPVGGTAASRDQVELEVRDEEPQPGSSRGHLVVGEASITI